MKIKTSKNNGLRTRGKIPKLFLASTSQRRKQLLEQLNLDFLTLSPSCDEIVPTRSNLHKAVQENSVNKGKSVLKQIKRKNFIIVSADTLVTIQGLVLEKPVDRADGFRMLQLLSGKTHEVFSGLYVYASSNQLSFRKVVRSKVTFYPLNRRTIEDYLDTQEPYDKSGAYAVQGLSSLFIKKIEGSFTNVMGLPIEEFLRGLEKVSTCSLYDYFK